MSSRDRFSSWALGLAATLVAVSTAHASNQERTAGERAAAVTPVDYSYAPGHLYRYGSNVIPGTTDMSRALQSAINSVPNGGVVYLPDDLISIGTTGITIAKSITLQGTGGREDYDNSWNSGGGSVIHYQGLSGDALKIQPPSSTRARIKVRLRDFLVRGARVQPGKATSGRGIYVDGRQLDGTAVHLDLEGVYVAEARDECWYITGAVYGGNARNVGAYDCGKNGMRILSSGSDPIGEIVWSTVRLFDNGAQGTDHERAGLWASPGATSNVFIGLSCTNNAGPGAVLQAGSFQGSGWQFESNDARGKNSQLHLGSAGAGSGLTNLAVQGLSFSPGKGYAGAIVNVTSDATNVKLHGVYFGDSLADGGKDLQIDGSNFAIYGISSTHPLKYGATAKDPFIEEYMPGFSATVGSDAVNVTGDSTVHTLVAGKEIFDTTGSHNTSTGVFTAPITGKYQFDFTVTLGDIAAGHDRGVITLVTSNRSYSIHIGPAQIASAAKLATWTGSFLADMDVDDTASVSVQVGSSRRAIDVESGGASVFSGRWVSK